LVTLALLAAFAVGYVFYYRHVVNAALASCQEWGVADADGRSDAPALATPLRLDMDEGAPTDPSAAAIGAPPGADAGQTVPELWVPLRAMFARAWPIVQARVVGPQGQDASGWFLLDTGCSSTVLDAAWAQQAGLPVMEARNARNGQRGLVRDVTVEVGPVPVSPRPVWCFDFEPFSRQAGVHICGAVGSDFFATHPVRIDYAHRAVEVGSWTYSLPSWPGVEVVTLPIYRVRSCPHVSVDLRQDVAEGSAAADGWDVSEPIRTEALIDTGFTGRMIISSTLASSVGIVDEGDCGCRAMMVTGAKEFRPARRVSASAAGLEGEGPGGFSIEPGDAFVADVGGESGGLDGIILGGEVFAKYGMMIVDYGKSRVVLVKGQ
jgi:predicted aspartyl protease